MLGLGILTNDCYINCNYCILRPFNIPNSAFDFFNVVFHNVHSDKTVFLSHFQVFNKHYIPDSKEMIELVIIFE